MEQINWTDEFNVGIEQIDEQHQQLIRIINRLIQDPQATTQSETVSDLLCNITKYANEHFKTEEMLMRKYNYPHIEAHIAQHRDYRKKVVGFCTDTMNRVESVPSVMLDYLVEWWTNHVRVSDMAYKPHIPVESLSTSENNGIFEKLK